MTGYSHPLDGLPAGAIPHGVVAAPDAIDGRDALCVELTVDLAAGGTPGVDFVDRPTFVVLPVSFGDGTIDVDLRGSLNGQGMPDSRAFVGIAYRISPNLDAFEAVYLRPLNGRPLAPPPPRDRRAVQHFTYPDWRFDRLRDAFPDGRFEAGADIGPDEWIHLHLDVRGTRCQIVVNDDLVLTVEQSPAVPAAGAVGLFVDTGSRAHFADLVVH